MTSARKRQALELFSGLPRHYDRVAAAFSFGQDPRWRCALVDAVAPVAGERVLDVATGTGMVTAELLARSDCSVVALDQSPEMLAGARARFAAQPALAARVELVEGQAEELPFADESFDVLTFTYLLRYVEDPAATLRELARVVAPGGRAASLEFGVPPGFRRGWRGAFTPRSGSRSWAGSSRVTGWRWDAFSVPASAASMRATRSIGSWGTGIRRGSSTCRCAV